MSIARFFTGCFEKNCGWEKDAREYKSKQVSLSQLSMKLFAAIQGGEGGAKSDRANKTAGYYFLIYSRFMNHLRGFYYGKDGR